MCVPTRFPFLYRRHEPALCHHLHSLLSSSFVHSSIVQLAMVDVTLTFSGVDAQHVILKSNFPSFTDGHVPCLTCPYQLCCPFVPGSPQPGRSLLCEKRSFSTITLGCDLRSATQHQHIAHDGNYFINIILTVMFFIIRLTFPVNFSRQLVPSTCHLILHF